MFSYYITTHFITSNKDYNFCCNLHSVYQTYPKNYYVWFILCVAQSTKFFFFFKKQTHAHTGDRKWGYIQSSKYEKTMNMKNPLNRAFMITIVKECANCITKQGF